ncbi:putative membrane protein ActII-3 [Acrocarpospora phusangensis]|uniref:Membrane protein ActII-3 n=1 Tax=Acrocarpospora phusangensis TaxID=1070424 RepID=A0A919Q676_9ACTN|nr:MMPL family transporter [Acrocarpospora phusangensis]GIH22673.1 putative membrane protein ActII-3 [Acrocarpospora phusangensis]
MLGRVGTWITLAVWLVVLAGAGMLSGKLNDVEKNDPTSFLPGSAESTLVQLAQRDFADGAQVPAIVVFEGRTVADVAALIPRLEAVAAGRPSPPIPSKDGAAVQVVVPLDGRDYDALTPAVQRVKEIAGEGAHVTGPAGQSADAIEVFGSIDLTLLIATSAVVIVVLLVTFRGPLLWIIPFCSAGAALVLAQAGTYLLAKYAGVTVSGQSAGILLVLVFGIATDYALLLVARYREELVRHQDRRAAMAVARRRAAPPIVASAATVIAALLCLLAAEQNSSRGLGPVCAVGVLCALAAMLTLLPALLVVLPRGVFWPRVPAYGREKTETDTVWGRIGRSVARRPRATWLVTTLVLGGLACGLFVIKIGPLAEAGTYRGTPDSVIGAQLLEKHFGTAQDGSLVVIGDPRAAAAIRADRGVAALTDPVPRGDQALMTGALRDAPDSPAAYDTVKRLREIDGIQVGGTTAVALDSEVASARDAKLIIPLILVAIGLILGILLRAVTAPLVLIATVVLSFAATLGVSGLVFTEIFGFTAVETGVPLLAFVFLVAVGVDYNIFLITRTREETPAHGTREAALRALAATGGVITSAGVVLAATFAVLGVLPLVVLTEIGFLVAFGVLLDTFVVRSVLLTALTLDLGGRIWWPGGLARSDRRS